MTPLTIDGQMAYNGIMLIVALVTFVFMYNKAIRNGATKDDIRESEDRQNEKIRAVHHRVDSIENRNNTEIAELRKDVKDILKFLTSK